MPFSSKDKDTKNCIINALHGITSRVNKALFCINANLPLNLEDLNHIKVQLLKIESLEKNRAVPRQLT